MNSAPRSRLHEARSLLFVPADRPDRIATALASSADAVIVDLEDAVRPENRAAARAGLPAALLGARKPVVVRVNALASQDHAADVDAALDAGATGIMLAKFVPGEPSATLDDDLRARELRHGREAPLAVIGLVESAAGMIGLTSAAAMPHRVTQLAWGAADLHLDIARSPRSTGGIADFAMATLVLASRAAQLPAPLDSPFFVVGGDAADDAEHVLAEHVARARALGFGGKLCIHPRQIAAVNDGFAATESELAWARTVVAAWDDASRAGRGAIAVGGELVDEAVIRRARQLLDRP
jgi:citrate lyase subunit beta/citryl-CoA lyase